MKQSLISVFFIFLTLKLFGQVLPEPLTQNLQQISEGKTLPGFAVSIVNTDSIIYSHSFGFSDISTKRPFTDETILNIGSVSKTFVGVALVKAVEQGYLTLNSNINDFLPFKVENPYFPDEPITIRHLVTHTSGIIDREKIYKRTYTKVLDAGDFKQFLKEYLSKEGKAYSSKNFSNHKPGAWQEYSNIGSTLAAYVIESATKMPFDKYTNNNIFEPLKLQATSWFFKDIDKSQHAILYNSKQKAIPLYSLLTYPDGGLKSNLHDLSIYLQEIIKGYSGKGLLLSDSAYSMLFQSQFGGSFKPENISPKEPNIGIFWVHRKNGEIGHTGGDPGITAFLFFNPKTATGRIFITNTLLEKSEQIKVFSEIWRLLREYEEKITTANKG